ncbi:MAG: orotate phosphoribosyltransferase [Clostridia bacterium]|nr:orotate phosphoribosyltransferase [Clostridia bacterium]
MPVENVKKVATKNSSLMLRVAEGHFATNHSHINYYIDVTMQKTRLSEAKAVASALVSYYRANTVIDTILCLDGMQVVGTCVADELTRSNFMNINAHNTIYVITPEHTAGSQLLLRDNIAQTVKGKNVLVLAASVTTGYTASSAIEAVKYYGGNVVGVSAIFATVDDCMGYEVHSVFDPNDLNGYSSFPAHQCPLCKQGKKIDALVNSFGYSKI